jgi:hypothetical protein
VSAVVTVAILVAVGAAVTPNIAHRAPFSMPYRAAGRGVEIASAGLPGDVLVFGGRQAASVLTPRFSEGGRCCR